MLAANTFFDYQVFAAVWRGRLRIPRSTRIQPYRPNPSSTSTKSPLSGVSQYIRSTNPKPNTRPKKYIPLPEFLNEESFKYKHTPHSKKVYKHAQKAVVKFLKLEAHKKTFEAFNKVALFKDANQVALKAARKNNPNKLSERQLYLIAISATVIALNEYEKGKKPEVIAQPSEAPVTPQPSEVPVTPQSSKSSKKSWFCSRISDFFSKTVVSN